MKPVPYIRGFLAALCLAWALIPARPAGAAETDLFDPAGFFVAPESDAAFPFTGAEEATIAGTTFRFPLLEKQVTSIEQDEPDGQVTVDIDDADTVIAFANGAAYLDGVEIDAAMLFPMLKGRYAQQEAMADDMRMMLDSTAERGLKTKLARPPELCQNTAETALVFAPTRFSFRKKGDKMTWRLLVGALHAGDAALIITAGSWSGSDAEAKRVVVSYINKFVEMNPNSPEAPESDEE